jgi:chaperonin GroES
LLKSLSELFTTNYSAQNVANLLDDQELTDIAQDVLLDYNTDFTTCSRKFEELKDIMALAMIVSQQKSYPWPNASNIIYPLIANAAINYAAICYPEIIQDDEIVKAKIIGKDNGKIATFNGEKELDPETGEFIRQGVGDKLKRGNRVATMMNWQLTEQMTWWETDMDKELHALPIVGTLYKKVYYDPLRRIPVSELIFPDKIVINNNARDIDSAVVTQIIDLYPQEILERIRSGYFKDFDFDIDSSAPQSQATTTTTTPDINPVNTVESNTKLHTFLEQHTWLDLDEDGFLETYIVTVHYESSSVVRIIPRFKEKDISFNDAGEVKNIKACKYFVVRRFLPSFDGGFLGIGFGHLLSNVNNAINTTLNQMMDAGHLAITGGGLISKNVKVRGGVLKLSPNEFKMVDVAGGDLQSSIFPMPRPEPSAVLFNLLGALIEAGKELASMRDVLNGEVAANTPATTFMGMNDQAHKQIKSIFKRERKSIKEELALIYNLDSEHLTNEEYARVLDEDEIDVDVKGDFNGRDYDIVPVADANSIISSQKFAQATFLTGFIGSPNVEQTKLLKQIFRIARITDTDDLVIPAPEKVDPAIQIAQMEMNVKMGALQVAAEKNQLETQKLMSSIPKLAVDIEEIKSRVMLNFANVGKISKETELAESKEQLDVMDNLVDAQVRQQEMALRREESQVRTQIDIAKLQQDAMKHITSLQHEKELNKAQPAASE